MIYLDEKASRWDLIWTFTWRQAIRECVVTIDMRLPLRPY